MHDPCTWGVARFSESLKLRASGMNHSILHGKPFSNCFNKKMKHWLTLFKSLIKYAILLCGFVGIRSYAKLNTILKLFCFALFPFKTW